MPLHLEHLATDREAMLGGARGHRRAEGGIIHLDHRSAFQTHQELARMGVIRSRAANERIGLFEAMNQPVRKQEVQSPVDGGRGGRTALGAQRVQKRVRAHGFMALPHQFQHPPPQFRELGASPPTALLGRRQGAVNAATMIVAGPLEGGSRPTGWRTVGHLNVFLDRTSC